MEVVAPTNDPDIASPLSVTAVLAVIGVATLVCLSVVAVLVHGHRAGIRAEAAAREQWRQRVQLLNTAQGGGELGGPRVKRGQRGGELGGPEMKWGRRGRELGGLGVNHGTAGRNVVRRDHVRVEQGGVEVGHRDRSRNTSHGIKVQSMTDTDSQA